jgi:glycine/sarcosine N-methyltransferase
MSEINAYDIFSKDYDRFVNWQERLSAELPFLVSELNSHKTTGEAPVTVLDAACGTGKHVIALTEMGFDCLGMDFSADMVNVARQNAENAGKTIPFKTAGFGQLNDSIEKDSFDAVICLGNSLPHLLDEKSLNLALEDFRTILKTGGKLIIQNRNFDKVMAERLRWMPPQTFRSGDKTWIYARYYDFDPDERLTFNILIFSSQGEEGFKQDIISTRLWPMGKELLVEHLEKTGFESFQFFGDLEGSIFVENESANLVIIAKAN